MGYAYTHRVIAWRAGGILAALSLALGFVLVTRAVRSQGQNDAPRPAVSALSSQLPTSVGPAPVRESARAGGYQLELRITPNRASSIGTFSLRLLEHGQPIDGARVRLTTIMLTMNMGYSGLLLQKGSGRYVHAWPPLEMSGPWRLRYEITPPGRKTFAITVIDHVT